jgi:hypothetical protein
MPSIPASSLHLGQTGNRCGSRTGGKRNPHRGTFLMEGEVRVSQLFLLPILV